MSCQHCGCDIVVPASDAADQTDNSKWAGLDEQTTAAAPRSPLAALLACAVPLLGFGLAQALC
ncbi:MAG: hypothetical protein GXP27_15105 [Planctomycetes bacterium]|nr:hypothetical protein [Planctomycetota bacterium]